MKYDTLRINGYRVNIGYDLKTTQVSISVEYKERLTKIELPFKILREAIKSVAKLKEGKE